MTHDSSAKKSMPHDSEEESSELGSESMSVHDEDNDEDALVAEQFGIDLSRFIRRKSFNNQFAHLEHKDESL